MNKPGALRPDYIGALQRYPAPLLAAALHAGWFIGDVLRLLSWVLAFYERWTTPGLIIGFFAATAAGFATVHALPWKTWAAQGIAFVAGIVLLLLVGVERETVLPLLIALICAVSLAAGFATRRGVAGYWLANAQLAANLAACMAAAGIVTLGGAIILHSAEALLDVRMRRIDDVLAILLWTFVLPVSWLALARFDAADPPDMQGDILLRILALVTDAILIPLMLILAAIIHLYAALIAVSGELPKGQIGWIVPVYLVAGYGIFLLARNPEAQFPRLRRLYGYFPAATAVPLILLGLAVAVRIEAYGVTEDRYMLGLMVLGGALLLGLAAVRRPLDIRLVPATAAILSLVAAVGPLSATTMTIRSQTARAYSILASVPPERWADRKDGGLSERQKGDLVSAIEHLRRSDPALSALAEVWPPHLPRNGWVLSEEWSRKGSRPKTVVFTQSGAMRHGSVTFIQDFFIARSLGSQTIESASVKVTLDVEGHWLKVSSEDALTKFDLSSLLTIEASDAGTFQGSQMLGSAEGRPGKLVLRTFEREDRPEGPVLLELSGDIILY